MEYTGKKRNPIISSVLILLMLLSNPPAKASSFKPVASNFSTKEYGNDAGIQNWGIDQGKNGEMYFANNKGMLVFDGFHWNLYPLPDHSIIRTVHVDGDSIFAGSYEEFGYFKKDSFGDFKYHSLSAKLKNVDMKNEEVWNIVKSGKNIYFQTFTSAFCYDGKKVSLINSKIRPLYFHNVNGKIYAPVIDDGYYMFDGKHYRKLFDKSVFGNDNVVAAISIMGGG